MGNIEPWVAEKAADSDCSSWYGEWLHVSLTSCPSSSNGTIHEYERANCRHCKGMRPCKGVAMGTRGHTMDNCVDESVGWAGKRYIEIKCKVQAGELVKV